MSQAVTFKLYARQCTTCNKLFNAGFVIGDGWEYQCSKKCFIKAYGLKDWQEFQAEGGEGDTYYTEWECLEDMQYYENGEEIQ